MTKYTAEELEKTFKAAASLRINRLKRGNEDVKGDGGYWEGGLCDWGGEHNLKKDCQEIARGLGKLYELKDAEKGLKESTSKQEFESIKSRLIRQSEELENSLQLKTSSASSMFYVCYIWSCFPGFIESKLKTLRNEVSRFKGNLNSQQYKFYEEIKALKLEQKQIENRMKENKRKAQSEKDPAKKALLLQLIEDDGQKLKENLKKQKEIPVVNLRFEPDKYVSDLIKAMKEAIENNDGDGSGGGDGSDRKNNRNKKNDNNNDDDDRDNDDDTGTEGRENDPNPKENKNQNPQNNQQLLIFAGIALLVIFYLYSQPSKKEPNYYDF